MKYCSNCGFQLGNNSQIETTPQKPKEEIEEEFDNQVIKKTVIKKKLSDRQIQALADSRKKMAEKRALAKIQKESVEETPKKEPKKEKEVVVEKVEEPPKKNTVYRRSLFS